MALGAEPLSRAEGDTALSLYHLLDPEVLANPYPLFHRLRREDPVHWDPFLHAWVVTRYADVLEVLHTFSADRTPTPEQLALIGLSQLGPIAQVMVKQMLFMDAPVHTRLRGLASKAFTPARIEVLKSHIQEIVNHLLDAVKAEGKDSMDVITELAEPLPAIVTAEMLGVPVADRHQLKGWSANFAEMLGNFQHNPDHARLMLRTVDEMTLYFRDAIQELKRHPREGLIQSLLTAEIDGDRLTEEEVIANSIITMVGGQETTTNLIGNGILTLLRYPDQMEKLRGNLGLIPSAVEEMLRFESPSQHTARLAPSDRELGGRRIQKRQAVMAVMAAANRDPDRFPNPDSFDITRQDNRHLAFGYAAHFCFGAPLARMEGQIAFETMLRQFPSFRLEPQKLVWRTNLGLRGLTSLKINFDRPESVTRSVPAKLQSEKSPNPAGSSSKMTEEEHHRILVEWNRTEKEYPADKCVHQLVEAQTERSPSAVAVVYEAECLTYKDLNARANQLAHLLRRKGIGPDRPVGVCLKRSAQLAVALLGVLKAGGACVPLDPDYPQDRLSHILRDSQAPVLITQPALHSKLGSVDSETLYLEPDWKILSGESGDNPSVVTGPENLAYVIYTSGSTGRPRGVMLKHRGLVNHNVAAVGLYGIQPSDRVLQFSSISFDIAVEEIYPTWVAGGAVIFRNDQTSIAGAEFLAWLGQQRITVLNLPTAYWHELVHEVSDSQQMLPPSLRLVIVGGEKASSSAYASWLKAGGDRVRWVNTYGPTETSVIVSAYEPDLAQPLPDNLPIGRPIANTKLYVLNPQLEPVPVGTPGELHIGGPGVARGYLNQPQVTAARFIPDPFSREAGARLYKTGDMVRYRADGNIEFLGRIDFQVKIRGFRVELGEIESILDKHPSVAQSVVVARENGTDKRLVGYIVCSQSEPTTAELRRFVKDRLPDYMVPSDFVFLKTLPLTPNGKVDRCALPEPSSAEFAETPDFMAPRDEFESRMAALWEQVLGKHPIGLQDNFFELGGHSLMAVRLMRNLEKQFEKKLSITALIQAPTLKQFAQYVRNGELSSSWSAVFALQPRGSRPPFFFVHGLGGTVLRFHELARHMPLDQPFYCFQAPGLDGKQPYLNHVEDMASCYLEHLRSVQPDGPYFLGGYSFGGLVALEMAQRLLAKQQDVRMLALVDTYVVDQQSNGSLLSRFLGLPLQQQIAYVGKRARRYRKGIKRRIDSLYLPRPIKEVREACAVAEGRYQPSVYPGQIVLFRASEKALRGLEDVQGGWRKYAAEGIELHEIDADHGNILNEPQVSHLAAELLACLERRQIEQIETLAPSHLQNTP